MSASPSAVATASSKRPLEDESSASGPTDQPDAKRPALDKPVKDEEETETGKVKSEPVEVSETSPSQIKPEEASAPVENGHKDPQGDTVVPDAPNGTGPAVAAVPETQLSNRLQASTIELLRKVPLNIRGTKTRLDGFISVP